LNQLVELDTKALIPSIDGLAPLSEKAAHKPRSQERQKNCMTMPDQYLQGAMADNRFQERQCLALLPFSA
jgi:hypothetical protein